MPAAAMIKPAPVISNMPNGASPALRATPSTRMLVEVPIIVSVPPRIVAYDSGISSFEGVVPARLAREIATGVRIATTGVLFRQAEITSARSEEHTSELQSLMRNSYAVFCLTKKNTTKLKHD